MNLKDELRTLIKYVLGPEESNEVDVVENYVDTFNHLFEEYYKYKVEQKTKKEEN